MDTAIAATSRTRGAKRPRTDHSDSDDSLSMAVRALPSTGALLEASVPIRSSLLAHCAATVTKLFKPIPALISKQLSETRSLAKLRELKSQGKIPKSMAKPITISMPIVPGDDGKAKMDLIDKKANAEKLDILINTRAAKLKEIIQQIATTRNETLAILKSELDHAGVALCALSPESKNGKESKSFLTHGFSPMDTNPDTPSVYSLSLVKAVVEHCSTAWDCQIQTVMLSLTAKQGAEERRKARADAKRQSAALPAADSPSVSIQQQPPSNFQSARDSPAKRAHHSAGHRKSRSRGTSNRRNQQSARGGHQQQQGSHAHKPAQQHGQREHTRSPSRRGRARGHKRGRGRGRGRGQGSRKSNHSQGKH